MLSCPGRGLAFTALHAADPALSPTGPHPRPAGAAHRPGPDDAGAQPRVAPGAAAGEAPDRAGSAYPDHPRHAARPADTRTGPAAVGEGSTDGHGRAGRGTRSRLVRVPGCTGGCARVD